MSRNWIYGNEVTSNHLVKGGGAAEVSKAELNVAKTSEVKMIAAKDKWTRRYAVSRDPITCHVITEGCIPTNEMLISK